MRSKKTKGMNGITIISLLWVSFIFCTAIADVAYFLFVRKISFSENSSEINIGKIDTIAKKVMFVAHPDDEVLWGGFGLIREKFLVVCVTCGTNQKRVSEFRYVMSKTNDDYIMLGYPDVVKTGQSDWKNDKSAIMKDIERILNAKQWDQIVVHNPDGEYGHMHHKMTSQFVTENANKNNLFYFGRFYLKEEVEDKNLEKLPEEEFDMIKDEILPIYRTQRTTVLMLQHMSKYQNWIAYKDWNK